MFQPDMIELTDLRHFAHVARAGSFSGGARLSHVTPPAVSKAVQKLEGELGVRLFERTTRRVALTEAGHELLTRCTRIFGELEELRSVLDERATRVAGEVRVAAMEVFSLELLPRALAELVRTYPDVVPLVCERGPRDIEQLVLDGRADVGFTIGGGGRPGLDYEELGRSTPVLVCGASHPLHGAARIRRQHLEEHPFVVPRLLGREGDPALDQFPEVAGPRRVGATIELLQMGVQLCIEGAFLGYFPEVSIRAPLADGRLHRLKGVRGATPFILSALTRGGTMHRPAVAEIIGEVRRHVRRAIGTSPS